MNIKELTLLSCCLSSSFYLSLSLYKWHELMLFNYCTLENENEIEVDTEKLNYKISIEKQSQNQ